MRCMIDTLLRIDLDTLVLAMMIGVIVGLRLGR
jgi:hypothetical protein